MSDLVQRAARYATQAHRRIDHRRKYSGQPYQVHLEAVATLVASVTDDPETIAAAWLHDTVEDTPATLEDIEAEFGPAVAELVEELTDISRPGDGNRAQRKELDRRHLALASPRAKTVKLADLIDNCRDIVGHDPGFARIYLGEMQALLPVLKAGDPELYRQALQVHQEGRTGLGLAAEHAEEPPLSPIERSFPGTASPHFRQMFTELFRAMDIADPLLSFDLESACAEVRRMLELQRQEIATIRIKGRVQGYVRREELEEGDCSEPLRHFTVDQVVPGESTLVDVIHVLTRHDYCFVSLLGDVVGVIERDDINKPMVRMWLFGIITIVENGLTQLIERSFPGDAWTELVSEGRLEKARGIQAERQRRRQHCGLIDCLQLSDKGQILANHPPALAIMGFKSKKAARRVMKELESLRNHLAHAQDIVTHDWAQIARMSQRLDEFNRA